MKNKPSQKDIVLTELRKNGRVSRNICISGGYGEIITRLSSIILTLRQTMNIETKEYENPKETLYILLDKPKVERFEVKNNKGEVERVIERKIW